MKGIKITFLILMIFLFFIIGLLIGWNKDNYIPPLPELDKQDFFESFIKNDLITKNIFICSELFQIEPELLISLIYYESKFDPGAENQNLNNSVDRGLMQLNSFTFIGMPLQQFYDIELNILTGSKHLKLLLDKYQNNYIKALSAYNCGEWRVENDRIPEKTINYVDKIIKYKNKLKVDYFKYLKENDIKKFEEEKL